MVNTSASSQTGVFHESWFGRLLLLRPRKVARLLAAHPALAEVERRETTMHLLVLFRNR